MECKICGGIHIGHIPNPNPEADERWVEVLIQDEDFHHPTLQKVISLVSNWRNKQGEEQCWYYPEIFEELCKVLGVEAGELNLPPRTKFETGCSKFQNQIYSVRSKTEKSLTGGHAIKVCDKFETNVEDNPLRLTTMNEYEKLSPIKQGYRSYIESCYPDSKIPKTCPNIKDAKEWQSGWEEAMNAVERLRG